MFSGYFKQEAATRESLDDGWLHTGDAGYVEPDGHLVVLGRLSDVVHTAKGERYIPNYIENRLKFSPYIKDAAVLGRGRDTLSAIICIDKDAVGLWAELRGISYISYADLSQKPQVIELDRLSGQARQPHAAGRPAAAAIRLPAQGVRPRRRRDHAHPQNPSQRRRGALPTDHRRHLRPQAHACLMKAQVSYETGEVGVIERTLSVQEA